MDRQTHSKTARPDGITPEHANGPGEKQKDAKAKDTKKDTKPHDNKKRADREEQDGIFNNLLEADVEFWRSVAEEERKDFYETAQKFYHSTLEEFRNGANDSVKEFKKFRARNTKWRLTLIILTGGLAILNVLGANKWPLPTNPATNVSANQVLSLMAAVYASILALLTTVEGFFKYPDQKATSRESRELYLDAYRTYEMLWLAKVYPFGYSPEGCFNASGLYRQLVSKDIELRRKMIGLTETQEKKATK
jgi:hypothetical protein